MCGRPPSRCGSVPRAYGTCRAKRNTTTKVRSRIRRRMALAMLVEGHAPLNSRARRKPRRLSPAWHGRRVALTVARAGWLARPGHCILGDLFRLSGGGVRVQRKTGLRRRRPANQMPPERVAAMVRATTWNHCRSHGFAVAPPVYGSAARPASTWIRTGRADQRRPKLRFASKTWFMARAETRDR
jgi:hypothetical protein